MTVFQGVSGNSKTKLTEYIKEYRKRANNIDCVLQGVSGNDQTTLTTYFKEYRVTVKQH